jgi:FtsZ-interacting cell division protein ZipA
MLSTALIVGAIVVVAILIVAAWSHSRRLRSDAQTRSERLHEQFGSEYDRTVAVMGDTPSAERELAARQKRVAGFDIQPLEADESERFTAEWLAMKATFVDDPSAAIHDAEAILGRVMEARGYPTGDFEQRFADVSVDHSTALERYRSAHETSLRDATGEASTEDLRQAVINDHDMFAELIEEPVPSPAVAEVEPAAEEVTVAAQ